MTQLNINVNDLIVKSIFNIARAEQTIAEHDLTGETMNVYVVTPVCFDDESVLTISVIAGNKNDGQEYGWLKVASFMYTGQGSASLTTLITSGIKEFVTQDVINNWINNPPAVPDFFGADGEDDLSPVSDVEMAALTFDPCLYPKAK